MTDRQPNGVDDICPIENSEWSQSDSLSFKNRNKETRKDEPIAPGVETCRAGML